MASIPQRPFNDVRVAKASPALPHVLLSAVPLSALLWVAILAAVGVIH